ncbi:MAG: ATP-binding protein, partial [Bacteroidota bacterium]
MLSLFETSSEVAGYRLEYMEVLNWGTFDGSVHSIQPEGNNSLLTGANASGKSTFIDALLTLLVPRKNQRFYNQSSGVEKKGDRTEETYVLGYYGNIQKEGMSSTSVQALRRRDAGTWSIILAAFTNKDHKPVTIFQVRRFSNGKLVRDFGIARELIKIENEFSKIDKNWKKRLREKIDKPTARREILQLFSGPTDYENRLIELFGMRGENALNLFNLIVGVKVLNDL